MMYCNEEVTARMKCGNGSRMYFLEAGTGSGAGQEAERSGLRSLEGKIPRIVARFYLLNRR
jgi:hypothetical protein